MDLDHVYEIIVTILLDDVTILEAMYSCFSTHTVVT